MAEPHLDDDDAGEEEGPDWRMLSKYTKSLGARSDGPCIEPFIPRRGEKDFEPIEALAPVQNKALQESRQALFAALSAGVRGHSSRDHVRCVWTGSRQTSPDGKRETQHLPPYVDGMARGVMFTSIGRWSRERKRLELAPEELLYLVERGTVECWTAENRVNGQGSIPMSVQWAWAEIIGSNHLSLERYQVYAYLKRLGYTVLRKEYVDGIWRSQNVKSNSEKASLRPRVFGGLVSIVHKSITRFSCWLKQLWYPSSDRRFGRSLIHLTPATRSLIHSGLWTSYESVFNCLRLIPSGPKVSLPPTIFSAPRSETNEGYDVFYYVYKPNNRFPKTNPPAPDFQVCVVDAEKMPIPSIALTSNLLDTVRGPRAPSVLTNPDVQKAKTVIHRPCRTSPGLLSALINILSFGVLCNESKNKRPFRQNIFAKLKRGERDVLLAVVDHGIISFLKFIETDFGGTPLVGARSSI